MKTKSDPLLGIEWVIGLMLICGIIAALIYEYPEDQIQDKPMPFKSEQMK